MSRRGYNKIWKKNINEVTATSVFSKFKNHEIEVRLARLLDPTGFQSMILPI